VTTRVWAAFDFPEQPTANNGRQRFCFTTAPQVLRTADPAQVSALIATAEQAALAGSWVVGGLGYGAGQVWDGAQPVQRGGAEGVLAHFEIYSGEPQPWPASTGELPGLDWLPETRLAGGRSPSAAIAEVRERIAAGDFYQVNLTSRWRAVRPVGFDLFAYFAGLAAAQPDGYLLYSELAGVASISPELFFHRRDRDVRTQPMKGTAPAERPGAELLNSAKDRAENLMIVDLLRNDLGRVCLPGTVVVDRLFELHQLPTLWQLTSTVSGRTSAATTLVEVFAALFPCGSVTGAPKAAAMAAIAELEASPRGWYCGALGVIRPGGEATFNVPIRTVEFADDQLICGVGSGIVTDSDPDQELAEWATKARFLGAAPLRAIETMRSVDGELQRREAHLARLVASCADLGLSLDLDEVLAALAGAVPASGDHRVRLVAGDGPPMVEVTPAPPSGAPVGLQLAAEPLDVVRLEPVIVHKTTYRAHYDRLRALADPRAFDVICHDGTELTECCLGSLALKLDGVWYTPPVAAGLLAGTMRAELLAAGRIAERHLPIASLAAAEELAFFNSVRGWCPAQLI